MPPIKPEDVAKEAARERPDLVYQAFNELIKKHWEPNERRAVIHLHQAQSAVVKALMATRGGWNRKKALTAIEEGHWLDVEEAYRAAGWTVKYDQPAFNESGSSYYTFSKPANRSSGGSGG
jgi:hypothetical protein